MAQQPSRLVAFLQELKRRKVYGVAAAYTAGAFVAWQAAEIAVPALGLPDSLLRFIVVGSLLGFPVAVVLAWIYEIHRDSGGVAGEQRHVGVWPIVAVVGVLGLVAIIVVRALQGPSPVDGPVRIAVYPLNTMTDATRPLGEGVADLISVGVDGTPGLTAVDIQALWPPVLQAGFGVTATGDDELAQRAREFEATHFVTGVVMDLGDDLQVALRVYESNGGRAVASIRAMAAADSLAHLVDQVTVDLVTALWRDPDLPAVGRVDQHATSNPQALSAYLEAMSHARRGRFNEATEYIERAVALDSTFALAHVAHFRIRSWVLSLNAQPFVGLRPIIDRAMAHRDRLTPRNRLRIEAARAMDETDAPEAALLLERILSIDPSDAGAWASLALLQVRYEWMFRQDWSDTRATVERALALDSMNVPLALLLGVHHLASGEFQLAEAQVRRLEALDTRSPLVSGLRAGVAMVRTPEDSLDTVLEFLGRADPETQILALRLTRLASLDRAGRLADHLSTEADQVTSRQVGTGGGLQIAAARGDLQSVDDAAHTTLADGPMQSQLHRYVVAGALVGVADSALGHHAAESLRARVPPDSLDWALTNVYEAWAIAWAVGAYHGALGDTLVARAYQDALREMPGGGTVPEWHLALVADIEARLAARRGDDTQALEAAGHAFDLWIIHNPDAGGWDPEPGIRFHFAERLRAVGRTEDADWLYRSFLPPHWASFYTELARERVSALSG